jgi:hypothetical protein
MKTFDEDSRPEPLDKGSLPKPNVARNFSLMFVVGIVSFILMSGIEWLISTYSSDQVVIRALGVARFTIGILSVVVWGCYEIEKRYQFFSQRIWRD